METEIVFVPVRKGRELTRMKVRVRDNFTCQDCGSRLVPEEAKKQGKRLYDVHHLNGLCGQKSRSYDKASTMKGLVTLCHKCHFNRPEHYIKRNKTETKIGKKNYQKIVKMKESGKTYQEIANTFGTSRQRVHQIYKRATKK